MKDLYRGSFKIGQMVKIMYAYAHSEKQAWVTMCRRIAKEDGVHPSVVFGVFDGDKSSYEIKREMVFRDQ